MHADHAHEQLVCPSFPCSIAHIRHPNSRTRRVPDGAASAVRAPGARCRRPCLASGESVLVATIVSLDGSIQMIAHTRNCLHVPLLTLRAPPGPALPCRQELNDETVTLNAAIMSLSRISRILPGRAARSQIIAPHWRHPRPCHRVRVPCGHICSRTRGSSRA